MLQKGTGERFKYKQAVKDKFPNAVCKRTPFKSYNKSEYARHLYAVSVDGKRISDAFHTAEAAWADAYCKL